MSGILIIFVSHKNELKMKQAVHIKNVREVLNYTIDVDDIRARITCVNLDGKGVSTHFSSPVFLNASIAILVLSGTGMLFVNYESYSVRKDNLILLSASHLFNFYNYSDDFNCLCLLVSKEFMDEMDSTDMIYYRIKYGVKLYNAPVVRLSSGSASLLRSRICSVDKAINDTGHFYYKEVILNNLFAFYLDLSNIIEGQAKVPEEKNLSRYESIIKSFIELLVNNYRTEHKVDFYSSKLNISSHYLTSIVQRITGQSVCDFIFEMLYSEARMLLTNSKLSVQEIAAILNFSDQSSFGKFFKRKSGVSPVDYRKK